MCRNSTCPHRLRDGQQICPVCGTGIDIEVPSRDTVLALFQREARIAKSGIGVPIDDEHLRLTAEHFCQRLIEGHHLTADGVYFIVINRVNVDKQVAGKGQNLNILRKLCDAMRWPQLPKSKYGEYSLLVTNMYQFYLGHYKAQKQSDRDKMREHVKPFTDRHLEHRVRIDKLLTGRFDVDDLLTKPVDVWLARGVAYRIPFRQAPPLAVLGRAGPAAGAQQLMEAAEEMVAGAAPAPVENLPRRGVGAQTGVMW
jgi:hypothetical protein